ncbi:pyridoxamine 5'-phosphate oxidase family protein [Haloferax sp. MBLA0076]|uniref:Pyridoxamine 5'-phosphate oxidase family protein n=1 Tax=Haloferax litoreum TaxID=2666140 RepID=A0A6A8GEJ8_9EURY|nr:MULTISPECIES: pyridoxamine 5'-phosphate oxidase family protein [Haloferax]KAB1192455.1 pyridoxamine 5'-phosphate oxidase family protein [Haloferax sp. CBA1148]MRX20922.1 pyridoxamine 5'-phosphate oxidase family protein [Haloferax litoreum]
MSLDQQTDLSFDDIAEVLARHETGVLSLAKDDEPYAIPISYGYDPDGGQFYVRLVSTPESEKRQFLTSSPRARLVVHESNGKIYRSVIAEGDLERVDPSEMTVERIVQYGKAKRPLFEIWGETKRDLDIQLFELDPDNLGGREVRVDPEEDAA